MTISVLLYSLPQLEFTTVEHFLVFCFVCFLFYAFYEIKMRQKLSGCLTLQSPHKLADGGVKVHILTQ